MPNHYLNHYWLIVNWTLRNKYLNQDTIFFLSKKGVWKCYLQNINHFVSVLKCQLEIPKSYANSKSLIKRSIDGTYKTQQTYTLTFNILTPEPIFTSRYGKIASCSVCINLYSGLPWRWYMKASSGMFFNKKLHPLIRHSISSSLSILETNMGKKYKQSTVKPLI